MMSCGKRLFTPACKRSTADWRGGTRIKTERFGGCRAAFFCFRKIFCLGWRDVFSGVFGKIVFLTWCFCGEVVVDCVVNRGALMVGFWRLKMCHCFGFYFCFFFERRLG
jgi:hypothetical protein